METRSRKRAEASSSQDQTNSANSAINRPSKRTRSSSSSSSSSIPPNPPLTRSRRAQISLPIPPPPVPPSSNSNNNTAVSMDSPAESSGRRRGGSSSHKGKEQEAERMLGLNFESSPAAATAAAAGGGSADEDNDSEGGVGILHQNFTSASSALQGLLRKLGAGLDDLLPSSALSAAAASSSQQGGRMKKILSGLRADGEEGRQVEALTQLCETLSIGTEDSLGSFAVDSFVPVLVGLLNHETNPDIMLLAARALTHLCDVLPSSCAAVVHYGAVPCFCARLLTIEYMDLAEQSLQALKKISQEHPTACLRAGALMAVLSYLDFFSTGVQRVALSTAANMCRKLPSDAADFVMEAVPLLTNLLNYHDSKVLEHASVCLTRIAEAFASSPEKLDELCNHGLVAQAAGLISVSNSGGQSSLSTSTYTGVIRLLSTCASGSLLAAKTLLLLSISGTLKDILSGSGLVASASVSPALSRPPEQIYEMVNLADELLPPLPQGTISLPMSYNVLVKGSSVRKSSAKQDESGLSDELSAREKLLQDQPELLQQFGMDLLPILTQVYGSSINGPIRHKCLSVIGKLMYYSSAEMIQSLLSATNISSFLAGILAWKDPQVLIPALQIAEILMEKLPDTFSKMFIREGVVHAIDSLICPDTPNPDKETDISSAGTSSTRSRRSRRRTGSLNTEPNSSDEPKTPATDAATSIMSGGSAGGSSLRTAVSACAKSFKEKYFPSNPDSADAGVTDDLLQLRTLCTILNSGSNNTENNAKPKGKGKLKAVGPASISFEICPSSEESLEGVISEMLSELSKGDGVSTFEFIGSGVVASLLNYLSCGTFGKEKVLEASLPRFRQLALRRYRSFVAGALPFNTDGRDSPMTTLIQKLQNALSSLERFPVVLSHSGRSSGSGGGARLSSGLSALSQPFKLRLCRAQGEKSLRDYSSNVVLIDPLASLAAVEEFLWPRVQRPDSGQKQSASAAGGNSESGTAVALPPSTSAPASQRPTTRSRSASVKIGGGNTSGKQEGGSGNVNVAAGSSSSTSSKGKGKAVLRPTTTDEGKGDPPSRSSSRRRAAAAALEKDVDMKPARNDSSSEDEEEMDASPVEIDDALMIDEDDMTDDDDDDHDEVLRDGSLPLCVPERVHDVKLGDSTEDSASAAAGATSANDGQPPLPASGFGNRTNLSSGRSAAEPSDLRFGSRGTMSFAAAAMAGLASVSGRGIRSSSGSAAGGRDRRGLPFGGSEHSGSSNRLVFTANGRQLSKNLTIYQAIQRQLVLDEEDEERFNGSDLPNDGSRFWSDIFTITYQKADPNAETGKSQAGKSKSVSSLKSGTENRGPQASFLDSLLQGELPCDLEKSNPTYNILSLLRVLEGLNQLAPRLRVQAVSDDFAEGKISTLDELYKTGGRVPPEEFVSNKLTPKLARQIQDVLALCSGSLPSWCYQMTKACPFLFPFETRRQYFYSTAFGLSRALHRLQQQQGADNHNSMSEREVRVGRLQRQKVRVSRNRILDSAAKVMEMFSSQKAVLEVEYFGEVGTGLGPTLEFYTLLSHDLQKAVLGLWRSNNNTESADSKLGLSLNRGDLVNAPLGLFPRPWPAGSELAEGSRFHKVVEYFRLVGRVMAKALQDGRLLDLPLSTAFYKLVLGQELDLYDILFFDTEFGKILQELQVLVERKKILETAGGDNNCQAVAGLRFRGAPIEDLCLEFSLPGYPDYALKGEENTTVNIYNLEEYISLVVDATVKSGIARQMEAFRSGFNQVFDITSLQIFSPNELDYLICGRRELWEAETLVDHIKFDHGYTAKSPVIVNLLEIMAEFTPEQQHAFCQFVTGAPRLPPGGLAALNPKLTIVRKHPSNVVTAPNGTVVSESADEDLPSVMTCANYLKLPPYSSKEVMYKKLMYAIKEGQGSFDLS